MEILVHNISHYDMVLELTMFAKERRCVTLGRPKFSLFQPTSQKIHQAIDDLIQNPSAKVVAPGHER